MAEYLLRKRFADAGIDARVASAGLLQAGNPAQAHGIDVGRGLGLDMSAHRSRSMTRDVLAAADLIVGMAREHVREAVVLDPALWPRTFTLKELVRRGEAAGPRRPDEALAGWLARVGQGRRVSDLTGSSPDDDVEDPIGMPRSSYERMAGELDDLTRRLVAVAFAGAPVADGLAPR
jgi:protein-tyrosine phosphatase